MEGKKPGPTGATAPLPRPHNPNKRLPYSLQKGGQGPGETPTPPSALATVRACTRRIKLPGSKM